MEDLEHPTILDQHVSPEDPDAKTARNLYESLEVDPQTDYAVGRLYAAAPAGGGAGRLGYACGIRLRGRRAVARAGNRPTWTSCRGIRVIGRA